MGLIARVTSNGKATNCTRRTPSAINLASACYNYVLLISYCTSNHTLLVNRAASCSFKEF